jgi:hypothetical protein
MEPSAPERREETDSAAWGLLVAPLTGSPVFTETAAREQPEREDILLAARVPEREELFEREEPFLSEFSRAEPQEDAERAPEPEEAETGDLFAVPEVPKPEPEWPFPSDPVSAST